MLQSGFWVGTQVPSLQLGKGKPFICLFRSVGAIGVFVYRPVGGRIAALPRTMPGPRAHPQYRQGIAYNGRTQCSALQCSSAKHCITIQQGNAAPNAAQAETRVAIVPPDTPQAAWSRCSLKEASLPLLCASDERDWVLAIKRGSRLSES